MSNRWIRILWLNRNWPILGIKRSRAIIWKSNYLDLSKKFCYIMYKPNRETNVKIYRIMWLMEKLTNRKYKDRSPTNNDRFL